MRINLPDTQRNHDFPADQAVISVTDPKGRITYCNSNFVNVSGYAREELLGQPTTSYATMRAEAVALRKQMKNGARTGLLDD
jgi:PAS domain S-box-containing protein